MNSVPFLLNTAIAIELMEDYEQHLISIRYDGDTPV